MQLLFSAFLLACSEATFSLRLVEARIERASERAIERLEEFPE